jgi:hypothetical protein
MCYIVILNFKNNQSLTRELQRIFLHNLIHDPQHTLDGMLVLHCFFCKTFQDCKICFIVAINGALLVVPGWRRAKGQRTHLRECIKMMMMMSANHTKMQ